MRKLRNFLTNCKWTNLELVISNVIDFCITKGIQANRLLIEEKYDLSSDYSLIIVHLSLDIIFWGLFKHIMDLNLLTKLMKLVENLIKNIEHSSCRATKPQRTAEEGILE